MRALIFQTLSTDPALNALGINANTIHTNHNADTPNDTPFIVIRYLATPQAEFKDSPVISKPIQFWVHDTPGDYFRINQILKRLRVILSTLETQGDPDGGYITDVLWQGNSDDFYDDEAKTINRYAQYQLTGSAVD
jgi:hypothetical protein